MNKFAMVAAGKPPRSGCIAIISGALLGAVSVTQPAQSADLYPYPYHRQYMTYRPAYVPYYRNCYSCGCQCNCYQCGCCGVARPYAPAVSVAERHWVQREYWERRYPADWSHNRGYAGGYYPYPDRYPNYSGAYPNYSGGYPDYSGASGGYARPHLGFGGIQYPPSRASYEYEAPPWPAYEGAPPRSLYEYEGSPRPPMGIPSAYYNAGYAE